MKAQASHVKNLTFKTIVRDHQFFMDTSKVAGGDNEGPTPKELLLAGIIGCAGMDVVSLFKKHKVEGDLTVTAEAETRKEHPRIFPSIQVVFESNGAQVPAEIFKEAVHLSLTRYCGVTAMVTPTVQVLYSVMLRGEEIAKGQANFT
jgi:putative redox protein